MGRLTGGWLKLVTGGPLKAQVFACWIGRNDQCGLSDPKPAFDLLLALDHVVYVLEAFEINQAIHFVLARKARACSLLMIAHATDETLGHARIECFRAVRHDANEISFLAPQDDPLREQDGRAVWPESVTSEHSREQSCAKPRELAIPVIRNRQYSHPERRLWPRRTYVITGSAKAVGRLHRSFGPKMPGIRMTRTTFTKVTSTLTCEIYNISISSY
jgi:hypothetical protein